MWGGTPFRITETAESEGVVRVAIAGELDMSTRSALQRRLRELTSRRKLVRLDLSRLEFVDASGLHVLVSAFAEATEHRSRLVVDRDLRPEVARVLSALGLQFG